jgi:hypothetical protein
MSTHGHRVLQRSVARDDRQQGAACREDPGAAAARQYSNIDLTIFDIDSLLMGVIEDVIGMLMVIVR